MQYIQQLNEKKWERRWRQYTESLYDKEGNPKIEDLQVEDGEEVVKRPEVLKSNILLTILEMKKENLGKAAGVNEIAYHQKC